MKVSNPSLVSNFNFGDKMYIVFACIAIFTILLFYIGFFLIRIFGRIIDSKFLFSNLAFRYRPDLSSQYIPALGFIFSFASIVFGLLIFGKIAGLAQGSSDIIINGMVADLSLLQIMTLSVSFLFLIWNYFSQENG